MLEEDLKVKHTSHNFKPSSLSGWANSYTRVCFGKYPFFFLEGRVWHDWCFFTVKLWSMASGFNKAKVSQAAK